MAEEDALRGQNLAVNVDLGVAAVSVGNVGVEGLTAAVGNSAVISNVKNVFVSTLLINVVIYSPIKSL